MPASTFFTVLGATIGFLASVFFCIGALRMRVSDIVDVTSSMWDYNSALVKLWAAQRADYIAGGILLVLAFVLQIIGAVTPSDIQPEIFRPIGCVSALIVAAFVVALLLATLLRNYLRKSVTEEVTARHQARLREEEEKAKLARSQSKGGQA